MYDLVVLDFQQYNVVSDTVAHFAMTLSRVHCQYNHVQGLQNKSSMQQSNKKDTFSKT